MKSKTNRFQTAALSLVSVIALGTTAKADMFDINDTAGGFGVADEGSYNWVGGTFWNTGTDAAADAGTATTATWTSTRAAYFVGAGDDTHYTVRLGPAGSSNVSVQNLAINVNAAGNAALDGAAGDVTIGNEGDAGIMTISGSNSCGAQAGGTLTVNNGIELNTKTMFFRGGNVVINGEVSGTGSSRIAFGAAFGLTSGTLTLANTANTFAGRLVGDAINPNFTLVVTKLADGGESSSIGTSSDQIGMNGGTLKYIGNTGAQSTNLGLHITNDITVIDASGATSADTISFSGTTTGAGGNRVITLTGTNTGTNTIAFDFGNFATGTNRFNKTGVGTWVLSGTNTYTGVTSISANGGMLQFAKTASLYNGDTASWTGGNIRVNNAATLGLNVGGTGEFTTGNVTTLLTNLGGLNGSNNSGFAAGSAIGFDTTNAAGGTFTVADVITDSTGFLGGAIGVTKLGTGTLVLSSTNSYTGATTVSGGTLVIDGDHSAATSLTTVSSGARLGGTGILGGNLQVNGGGGLAIVVNGTNPAKLTVNGDVTLEDTSSLTVSTQGDGFNQSSYVILEYTGTLTGTLVPQEGYLIEHNVGLKQLILTEDTSSSTPYETWIDTYYPDSTDPNQIGETADPDSDGLENALEFLLGSLPDNGTQTSLPVSQKIGTNLVFTFDQVAAAVNAGFIPTVEYSTSLASDSWATATAGMILVENEGATDAVTVTIPIPEGATKLFARIKLTTP